MRNTAITPSSGPQASHPCPAVCVDASSVRILACVLGIATTAMAWPAMSAEAADEAACAPDGEVAYICGLVNPEDLVPLEGSAMVLVGKLGPGRAGGGGLYLVDGAAPMQRQPKELVPDYGAAAEAIYAECPSPPPAEAFAAHGLSVQPRGDQRYRVYAVNHGTRESVEVFDLDIAGAHPQLIWRGCVVAPREVLANAVVHLPDGALAVTSFGDRSDPESFQRLARGEKVGFVAEWSPESGWKRVAGTAFSGNNGIAASPDGQRLYVASWGDSMLHVVPRDGDTGGRHSVALPGFLPDNIRVDADGSLLVAGQAATPDAVLACAGSDAPRCLLPSRVVRVAPDSLAVEILLDAEATPSFGAASVAAVVGDALWVGTFRGDRIARYPLERMR